MTRIRNFELSKTLLKYPNWSLTKKGFARYTTSNTASILFVKYCVMSLFWHSLMDLSLEWSSQDQVIFNLFSVWQNQYDILWACHGAWVLYARLFTSLLKKNSPSHIPLKRFLNSPLRILQCLLGKFWFILEAINRKVQHFIVPRASARLCWFHSFRNH